MYFIMGAGIKNSEVLKTSEFFVLLPYRRKPQPIRTHMRTNVETGRRIPLIHGSP